MKIIIITILSTFSLVWLSLNTITVNEISHETLPENIEIAIDKDTEEIEVNDTSEDEPVEELMVEYSPSYSLDDIIWTISEATSDYKDNISVYYYNFNTQDEYYLNEDTYYMAASLRKVPQVMEILDKIALGQLTFDSTLEYNHSTDYQNGTGILQFEDYIGSRTISELLELSITESDNIAFNMLRRYCGNDLLDYTRYLTNDSTIPDGEYFKLTAKQNYKILSRLYNNPDNNPYYSKVLDWMKETAFHSTLDKYLPYNQVAHKIGSYYRYYHDAGIIFSKEDYILIVMTKDIGTLSDSLVYGYTEEERHLIDMGATASEVIANISKNVYDLINGNIE